MLMKQVGLDMNEAGWVRLEANQIRVTEKI